MKTTVNKMEQLKLIVTTSPQPTPKTQVSRDGFTGAKIKNSNEKPEYCKCNFAELVCFTCASSSLMAGGFCACGLINVAAVKYELASFTLAKTIDMSILTGGLCLFATGIAGYQIGACIDQCAEKRKNARLEDEYLSEFDYMDDEFEATLPLVTEKVITKEPKSVLFGQRDNNEDTLLAKPEEKSEDTSLLVVERVTVV